jgi:DNA polymerase III alpha subunit
VEGDSIRFGLGMISGVNKAAFHILQERKENGEFKSFLDFFQRTRKNATLINKKIIENLIFSGAFGDKEQEKIYLEYIKLRGDKNPEPIGWSLQNMIERERNALDVNLSYQYENTERFRQCLPISELKNEDEQMIAFVINKITKKKTKNKKDYTLLNIMCMNSKNKLNLFVWDNGSVDWEPFLNQPMIKYIKKSNDFYTLNLFRQ